jgi:hypothetical protein
MKRQAIAVAVAGLFALPVYANNEIDAGNPPYAAPESTLAREQVHAEILAAKSSADWRINAELGTVAGRSVPRQFAGKSRAEVLAELVEAQRNGDVVVNAELGLKANQFGAPRSGSPVAVSGGTRAQAQRL